jgi:hypothetical protein
MTLQLYSGSVVHVCRTENWSAVYLAKSLSALIDIVEAGMILNVQYGTIEISA